MSDFAHGNIFDLENKAAAIFDPQTVRDSWTPIAAAWRRICGHYHASQVKGGDWSLFPKSSSVVFCMNGYGTLVAVRVLNGEYVGFCSLITMNHEDIHENDSAATDDQLGLAELWMSQVCLELT